METKDFTRIYSSKYDSTKQRYVYDDLSKNLNQETSYCDTLKDLYLRYSVIMRLEILFGGTIVITDAQYFDGLFFHGLTLDKDNFNQFRQFVTHINEKQMSPLIEVRVRENLLQNLFCKKFDFSSILNQELHDAVYHACGVVQKLPNVNEINSIECVFENIEKVMERKDFNKEHLVVSEYNDFKCHIIDLYNSSKELFKTWKKENIRSLPNVFSLHKATLHDMLDNIFKINDKYNKNTDTRDKLYYEIQQDYPNRSKVKKYCIEFSDLYHMNWSELSQPNLFRDFYIRFDKVYNMGIAEQHECKRIDISSSQLGEIKIKYNRNNETKLINNMQKHLIDSIGGCSWGDFMEIYLSNNFAESRENWLKALTDLSRNHSKNDLLYANRSFERLCMRIQFEFEKRNKHLLWMDTAFYNQQKRQIYPSLGNLDFNIDSVDIGLMFDDFQNDYGIYRIVSNNDYDDNNSTTYGTLLHVKKDFLHEM